MENETLIQFGGAVKTLGDGKVGGYTVLFSNDQYPDLEQEFFQKDTDFATVFPLKMTVYYNHGMDKTLGLKKLGGGPMMGEAKMDDTGIWIEVQLDMRDDYEKAIYDMAGKGKLGWSSGTAKYLTRREKVNNSYKLTSWPLGLDASITPTPAEPRTAVLPLKSWMEQQTTKPMEKPEVKGVYLGDYIEQSMTIAAISRANDALFWSVIYDIVYDDSMPTADKQAQIAAAIQEFASLASQAIASLLTDDIGEINDDAMKGLREHWFDPKEFKHSKDLLKATKRIAGAVKSIAEHWSGRIAARVSEGKKSGLNATNTETIKDSYGAVTSAVILLGEAKSALEPLMATAGIAEPVIAEAGASDETDVKSLLDLERIRFERAAREATV